MEVTYSRALKIWWSYVWRMAVSMLPVMILMPLTMFLLGIIPKPGDPPFDPSRNGEIFAKMSVLWVFMMTIGIAVQVFAMRWMLRTNWSDFKLQVVETTTKNNP